MYFWKSYRHPNFIKYICPLSLYAFAFKYASFFPMYPLYLIVQIKKILNPKIKKTEWGDGYHCCSDTVQQVVTFNDSMTLSSK